VRTVCREGNGTTYWRDGSIYSGEYRAVSIPANTVYRIPYKNG
jgi:hypothetical protein